MKISPIRRKDFLKMEHERQYNLWLASKFPIKAHIRHRQNVTAFEVFNLMRETQVREGSQSVLGGSEMLKPCSQVMGLLGPVGL